MLSGFVFTNLSLNSLQVNVLVFNCFFGQRIEMPAQRQMAVGRSKPAYNPFPLGLLAIYWFSSLKKLGTNRISCLLKCLLIETFIALMVTEGR